MNTQISSSFAKYASLSVMGMIGLSCYILADTFFVAQGLGTNGLAALNLAIPVYSTIVGTGMMTGMGAATRYSIMRSRNDSKADKIFTNALYIAAALAVIFEICGIFFSGNISKLLGAEGDTYELCRVYLKTLLIFSPFFLLNNISICFLRNDNAPQRSMAGMLAGSFANIVLDYIFIFPMGWGLPGAALATAISPVISISICSRHFFKKENSVQFVRQRPSARLLGQSCQLGISGFVGEMSSGVTTTVFNFLLLGLAGNVAVAAYGVVANFALVATAIFNGVAQGAQPLVSECYGKSDKAGARKLLILGSCTALVLAAVLYGIIFGATDALVGVFNSENSAQMAQFAHMGMRLYFVGYFFAGFNIVAAGYLSATDRPVEASVTSICRGMVAIVACSLVLSRLFGMNGVWAAFPASELLTAVLTLFLLLRGKKQTA